MPSDSTGSFIIHMHSIVTPEHHCSIVPRGLRGALNWAPIMPSDSTGSFIIDMHSIGSFISLVFPAK